MSKPTLAFCGEVTAENLKNRVIRYLEIKGYAEEAASFKSKTKNINSFSEVFNIASQYVNFRETTLDFFKSMGVID